MPVARRLRATVAAFTAAMMLAFGHAEAIRRAGGQALTLRTIVVSSREAAEKILERLKAGESFVLLAKAESTAPSAQDGGWLGKILLQDLRPEVRHALEGVTAGHITPAVPIPTGYAIFRVEQDEVLEEPRSSVAQELAAAGAVKYVDDLSGFTDARVSLEALEKPPDWNMNPRTICDARRRSLGATRSKVEEYLSAGSPALAPRLPLDLLQAYFGLAQLDAFEGRMDAAIVRLEQASAIARTQVPGAALQMYEALGVAHLHRAGVVNDAYAAPGESCLLTLPPVPYRNIAEVDKAIDYFSRYLNEKPDELEVRWLLNIAYMRAGRYPAGVPPKYLIPPAAFGSAEDVGKFRDVAPQAGLVNFASAGGVLVDDFGNTGRFDVITSTADKCGSLRVLANNGDGTFADRTAAAGLSGELGGLNVVSGDFNNDGCPDVLVLRGGWEELPQRKSLLRNNCDGTFADVTAASGLATPATAAQTAVWTDIDNDGFLDLFVGVEAGPAQLFRNRRDGTFQEIATAAGVDRTAYTKGVASADYDNDGYADLYVSNYGGPNFLYHNNRDATFTEMSVAARVLGTPQGFATWFFDYDNDGWTDLFVTSYVASIDEMVRDYLGMPHRGTTMKLYRNLGDGSFRDESAALGLNRVRMPMGANFGDIDNDGFLDIYLGTGNPSYGALAGSVLLRNRQGRAFADVTTSSGTGELHRGHGVAFADLDNDGDEDIVFEVGGMTQGDRHAIRLFENPGHGNDWIALRLVGVKSNRTAVGARIKVTVTDASGQVRTIHRTVTTGGSFGASPLLQHVGLGKAARTVDLDIWWPATDSRQHLSNVGKNRWLEIEEFAKEYRELKRTRVRLGGPRQ